LLDHGLYRELDEGFRRANCRLWQAMLVQDQAAVVRECHAMNMPDLAKLMPFMLINRPAGTSSALGSPADVSAEELARLKEELGISNLSLGDIGELADKLPGDMVFVLKVWHLVKDLNDKLGGTDRERFLLYARHSVAGDVAHAQGLPGKVPPSPGLLGWLSFYLRYARFLGRFLWHELRVSSVRALLSHLFGPPRAIAAPTPKLSLSHVVGETLAV